MSDAGTAFLPSITFRRLVWAIPAVYAVHVLDEARGDFPAWISSALGGGVDGPVFALSSAFFLATGLALVAWASVTGWRVVIFLLTGWTFGHLFWDSLFHLGMSLAQRRDSPGLASALFLDLPLSILVAACALRERLLGWRMLLLAGALGLLSLQISHFVGGSIQPSGGRTISLTLQGPPATGNAAP